MKASYFYQIKRILLISDTHGYISKEVISHAQTVDEVWHAGDWGNLVDFNFGDNVELRGVYGNIDDILIRNKYPKELHFQIEGLKVYMTHIGGYPGRYAKGISQRLDELKPGLYICGHSHICKVMRDKKKDLIHFNPGAIGNKGFHKKRTMMKFAIEDGKLIDINILEYDKD